MKVFIHLALDAFGAECLARLARLLDDIATEDERHLFVWAGLGEAPKRESYWSDAYPPWDSQTPMAKETSEQSRDFGFDRSSFARRVSESLAAGTFRDQLIDLFDARIRRLLGPNEPAEATLMLCGSLADPVGSATLLGILHGLVRLRRLALFRNPAYAVVGTGFRSGPFEGGEEKVRALVARSLLDLEGFFNGPWGDADSALPIYLVGEESSQNFRSTRATEVALGGYTLTSITRSALRDHQSFHPRRLNPFQFRVDEDRQVKIGENLRFMPQRAFSVVGAYGVHCPADRLARLLAAIVCEQIFKKLLDQDVCSSIEECAKLSVAPETESFLKSVEDRAADHLWQLVGERSSIPWREKERRQRQISFFDLGRIKQLFGPVFETREWERLIDAYGAERLKALPLEDWNGAVDELVETIESGFLPLRRQQTDRLTRRILIALRECIDRAVGEVFEQTGSAPVHMEPHRCAQALLGRIYLALAREREEIDKIQLETPISKDPLGNMRRVVERKRKALADTLSIVPSPAAVFLRMLPIVGLLQGIFLILPGDWMPFGSALGSRFSTGTAAGVVTWFAAVVVYYELVVRRTVWKVFRDWLSHYKGLLKDQDDAIRDQAYADPIDRMHEFLEWYYNGTGEEPPLPDPFGIPLKRQKRESEKVESRDALSYQTALSDFKGHLQGAADGYIALREVLLHQFQRSFVETVLPEITVADRRASILHEEYNQILEVHRRKGQEDRALEVFLRNLRQWAGEGSKPAILPFESCNLSPDAPVTPSWRRSFDMPGDADLLDDEVREQSSGFLFFRAVKNFIMAQYRQGFSLPSRLAAYLRRQPTPVISESSLFEKYANLSAPSIAAQAHRPESSQETVDTEPFYEPREPYLTEFVVGAGHGDALAGGLDWPENSLGRGQLSLHHQVKMFLSAGDVIFYPSEAQPTRPLGLSWKAHLHNPFEGKAFEAVDLGEETP
jgi:hypothetical protein